MICFVLFAVWLLINWSESREKEINVFGLYHAVVFVGLVWFGLKDLKFATLLLFYLVFLASKQGLCYSFVFDLFVKVQAFDSFD